MSDFEKMLFSNELRVKLTNIAMSKTFNEFDSDDLVQQTYLKALEKQDQFKGGLIDKWVVTILKNLHIDNFKNIDTPMKEITDHRLYKIFIKIIHAHTSSTNLYKVCYIFFKLFNYSEIYKNRP